MRHDDPFEQGRIENLKQRLRKRYLREIASYVGDDPVTIYGLKDFGTAFSWDVASLLESNGYDVFAHITLGLLPKPLTKGREREIHGMDLPAKRIFNPFISGKKLLFFVYQLPADDAPYLYARRLRKYEHRGVKPLDSRVVAVDDFQMLDNDTIYRDKFLEALRDEHGMARMRLGDIGMPVSQQVMSAGPEVRKFLRGNGCLVELPSGLYPAVGTGIYLLNHGERAEYVQIIRGSELGSEEWDSGQLDGRNVLVFNGKEPASPEDLELFQRFGAADVKSFREFVSESI